MRGGIRGFRAQVSRQGLVSAVKTDLHKAALSGLELVFRLDLEPSLRSLAASMKLQSVDGLEILKNLGPGFAGAEPGATELSLDVPSSDERELGAHTRFSAYPFDFGMDASHLRLLGGLVRALRPSRVVETGVADGNSTRTILRTLASNGVGRLTSFDVFPDVGSAVDSDLRERWDLVILPRVGRRRQLVEKVASLGPVDLFLHDSDHSYSWQTFEYKLAFQSLRPGGLLVSDDIDASFAFIDFVVRTNSEAFACVGASKVMGVILR